MLDFHGEMKDAFIYLKKWTIYLVMEYLILVQKGKKWAYKN